ncbi:MAG: aspartate-semialdehyde dehydrogenase [Anaerolineae bacterium]|nr:aspartate-semialdehyde dehydrogenase [Anaerolineae bacterium]MDQ7034371.1 aspartate-semialdehyde dehydrogenase [Anaerolineae bacterium]
MQKLNVAILGATGAVGQRFIQLLDNHPWFAIAELVGKSSAGKRYGDVVNWILDDNPPTDILDIVVKPLDSELESLVVFSALPKEAAVDREPQLAAAGHIVCTNASAHRMADDVPLLLPEVNPEHIALIDVQRKNRGWATGALIANSNCTTMPIVMALAPLRQFNITKMLMVSEQAISGAGYPGVASLDIMDNIVPYVSGDENKMETETLKMLGTLQGDRIDYYESVTSATATRVPVIDGHLINLSIELAEKPSMEAILQAWESYDTLPEIAVLPSAPQRPVQYLPQINRPQPRRDRMAGKGMMTSIGRLRECPILGYKFAAMAHNTIRGAAGCSILNAEFLAVRGYLGTFRPQVAVSITS